MPSRRLQLLVFLLSWVTFGWFHQGGGWNQNARFAEVRALVEQGRFAINDYMVYRPGEGRRLVRFPVRDAEFVRDGKIHRLCWGNDPWDWQLASVNGRPIDDGTPLAVIGWDTCTGDIGYAPDGHFHPNKPPGLSMLAVPPYFVLFHIERWLGLDADDWWVMNVNAWLCSAFTVGLASALCVLLVTRLAAGMFPGNPGAALGAGIVAGFGTTLFPCGTLMFDHNVTAVLLLASFGAARGGRPLAAGAWAGFAAVTNYLSAIPGAMFAVWILCGGGAPGKTDAGLRWKPVLRFTAGVLPSLIALIAYNLAAFGNPFALNTNFQNPAFKETAPAFLGMFTLPSWFATLVVTVSPWRGIFVLSPVILCSMAMLLSRRRMAGLAAERWLILAVAAFFFLINICFNGYHGGFVAGPRYLIPAMPFLCLPLGGAFARWPVATWSLAALSIVQQTLLTVTDTLNPLGVGSHAWVNHPDEWKEKLTGNSIVWRYAWPLFSRGRAWPVIDAKFEEWAGKERARLEKEEPDPAVRETRFAAGFNEAWRKVLAGQPEPLWIAAIRGPVSSNVIGPWDGSYFQIFPYDSEATRRAAFNVGELAFPESRWSLGPLLALWIAGALTLRTWLRDERPAV